MEILHIEDLSFKYPDAAEKAVDGISFGVESGEFIVLCGSSGCGKTTLLKLLKRELAPVGEKSGNVLYRGAMQDELDERESACKIGYVMQNPDSQIVTDKVWHELAFGLENMGLPTEEIRLRVGEMASYFGIHKWFRKNTDELSGGEKQLLNLASVMVMQPDILILDEPTSQLDPIAASDFIATLKKLNRETGLTVILAEHRLEDVFPIADRVLVMDGGRAIVFDRPENIGGRLYGIDETHPMLLGLPSATRIFNALNHIPFYAKQSHNPDSSCNPGEAEQKPASSCDPERVAEGDFLSRENEFSSKDIQDIQDIQDAQDVQSEHSPAERPGILGSSEKCPLTVKEGRDFLERHFVGNKENPANRNSVSYESMGAEPGSPVAESALHDAENSSARSKSPEPDGIAGGKDDAAVELKNVWFRYEKDLPDVLRGTSLRVNKGELFCIVGGNGTGKTTTLNVISGLGKAYRGKVMIGGRQIKEYKNGSLYRNNLAFLPQNPQTVFIKDNVRDDLTEILKALDVPKKSHGGLIDRAAGRVGITHLLDRHPYDLSGGEQQKCALAKMLLLNPKILLLDEPTKGLDAYSKHNLSGILKELKKDGITIVMVTHDVEFAAENADRCALFFDGEILSCGTPEKFFAGNSFYTTAASRMSRGLWQNAVTCELVVKECKRELCGRGGL